MTPPDDTGAPASPIAARLARALPAGAVEMMPAAGPPDLAALLPAEAGAPVAVWTYHDAEARPVVVVARLAAQGRRPRQVVWTHGERDEGKGWHEARPVREAPPYRLPALAASPGAPVVVAEGEAVADRLAMAAGTLASACIGGWKAAPRTDWAPLAGRAVTLAGRSGEGMDAAAAAIRRAGAASVRAVTLGAAWREMTPAALAARLAEAAEHMAGAPLPDPTPPPAAEGWRAGVARLAALDDVALAGAARDFAAAQGKPVSDVRRAVAAARKEQREQARAAGGAAGAELPPDARGRVPLKVDAADLPDTAAELVGHLAARPHLFDRGGPARLVPDAARGGMVAQPLTPEGVVTETHAVCRPYREEFTQQGAAKPKPVTLPPRVAMLALDLPPARWPLRALDGIASSPLLSAGGGLRVAEGYDPVTRMWCEEMPAVAVPEEPGFDDAQAALDRLRHVLRTFPFADADTTTEAGLPVQVVDLAKPARQDESAALAGLLTAIARASLPLAPGLVVRAAQGSGAGTGKGLLVRALATIAHGRPPHVVTYARDPEEMEKRIVSALIEAQPVVLLDNMNGAALHSDTLATAMTERPANIRPLGKSATVPINPTTFVTVSGNGLRISEDLTRRFLMVELDAGMEDPTRRPFAGDFLETVRENRAALLADALTIWRWGQGQGEALPHGAPIGSFGLWARWVRDPLLALGCADPVLRLAQLNADDPKRRDIAAIFAAIFEGHQAGWWTISDLTQAARDAANPNGFSRQFLATRIRSLEGTRAAGFVLLRHAPEGKHSADRYRLQPTGDDRASGERAPDD